MAVRNVEIRQTFDNVSLWQSSRTWIFNDILKCFADFCSMALKFINNFTGAPNQLIGVQHPCALLMVDSAGVRLRVLGAVGTRPDKSDCGRAPLRVDPFDKTCYPLRHISDRQDIRLQVVIRRAILSGVEFIADVQGDSLHTVATPVRLRAL